MSKNNYALATASTYIWIGFVGAISFMEAWLKFKAPNIDLPLGLGIGRLVFSALNKVEWTLAILILLNLFFTKNLKFKGQNLLYFGAVVIIILQTFWLLPALDARAEIIIQKHQEATPSNLHWVYIGVEVMKIVLLFLFGKKLFGSK